MKRGVITFIFPVLKIHSAVQVNMASWQNTFPSRNFGSDSVSPVHTKTSAGTSSLGFTRFSTCYFWMNPKMNICLRCSHLGTLRDIKRRSQWPRGLRRRSTAACPLRLWVRIPPGAWMFICCECRVLSGWDLGDRLITRPEESYRLWRVVVCDQETSKTRRQEARYRAVKIQPQWVVTPGKQTTTNISQKLTTFPPRISYGVLNMSNNFPCAFGLSKTCRGV